MQFISGLGQSLRYHVESALERPRAASPLSAVAQVDLPCRFAPVPRSKPDRFGWPAQTQPTFIFKTVS